MAEGDAPKEDEKPAEAEEKTDLKEIVTTDFMKGLVSELNLDIDQDQMGDLMKEAGIGDDEEQEEEKKEEEKKDGGKKPEKKDGD